MKSEEDRIARIREGEKKIIAITRIWTWREPHWWPKASCGKFWAAPSSPSAGLSPPPGTDETAPGTNAHKQNHSSNQIPLRSINKATHSKEEMQSDEHRAYPVRHHFRWIPLSLSLW